MPDPTRPATRRRDGRRRWPRRLWWPAALALYAAWVALVPPPAGLADNGDFYRVTGFFDLAPDVEDGQAWTHHQVNLDYRRDPHLPAEGMPSSEWLLAAPAVGLYQALVDEDAFHLRWLGAIHALVFVLGATWLALLWQAGNRAAGAWASVAGFLVAADLAYVSYFNSFYQEPATLVFLLGTVAAFTAWARRPASLGRAAALAGMAVLFLTAKAQNSPMGLVLAAGVVVAALLARGPTRRPALVNAVVVAAVTLVTALTWTLRTPAELREINLYNAVFLELLPDSPDAVADLETLGLSPDLARFEAQSYWDPRSPVGRPSFRREFYDRLSHADVAEFYLRHPGRLLTLLRKGLEQAPPSRPPFLAVAPAGVGRERVEARTLTLWSSTKLHLSGSPALVILPAVLLAPLLLLVAERHRGRAGPLPAVVLVTVASMAAMQLAVVLLGEGRYEFTKHLLLFHALWDLVFLGCTAVLVGVLAGWVARRRRRRTPDGE